MVRRTKEEAQATRESILDAAELLFAQQGVSTTTLQHIATAAGVTRGAIYWHFEDKASVFNALMERAKLPLESALQVLVREDSNDPLGDLREYALCVFRLTVDDARARRVFEIALLKMEYVDELTAVRERRRQHMQQWDLRVANRLEAARRAGHLRAGVNGQAVALGLMAIIEGLIRNWLMAPVFDLMEIGRSATGQYLAALRA
jgi:TetR/AcrR family acrAB operon transcriptional repressor